jgi:hypothetical protein
MTPKEKAQELFNKYCYAIRTDVTDSGYFTNVIYAKQCALIAVDEMEEVYASAVSAITKNKELAESTKSVYLQEVKQEILKL